MRYLVNNPKGTISINGSMYLQGAKNSMLNNLCLPLLTNDECIIENVPRIKDIETNLSVLQQINAKVIWIDNNTVSITCDDITNMPLSTITSIKTTGSKFFIPLMVGRFGEYITGPSGGCDIGDRGFLNYANSLEVFGIKYTNIDDGLYRFYKSQPRTHEYALPFPSFGLTVDSILAALALNEDFTVLNACQEPEIDNTIDMINLMGGNVKRTHDTTILIQRINHPIHGCNFRNLSDRNAAVTYSLMALVTNGHIEIKNFDDVKMQAFYSFLNALGAKYEAYDKTLIISPSKKSFRPVQLQAFLYPEFHSDWQPLVGPLLTQVEGTSYIEEKLFPNRLAHWDELGRMGARYKYDSSIKTRFNDDNPHAVYIYGKSNLSGAEVKALNLRAGAALVIASLIAKGETTITNAEEITRGYENMIDILKSFSVDIREEN